MNFLYETVPVAGKVRATEELRAIYYTSSPTSGTSFTLNLYEVGPVVKFVVTVI